MKVKEPQIARALDNPDGVIRLYLLYGPDEAGSRALAARLERAMGSEAERIDIDGSVLKEDPARLADEAASISLFGDKRFIRISGGDECAAAVAALLGSEAAGNPVVLIAGALKPASALLKAALDHPLTLACANFAPEGASADALAVTIARGNGLRLQPGVAARLAANCLGDRAVLSREIEKLALYLDAAPDRPRDATSDALDAVGANLSEFDNSRLVDAVLSGDLIKSASALEDAERENAWVPALRALQRRLILLARLRAEVDGGKSPSGVIESSGKSLFWKEKDAVALQLSRWPSKRLTAASIRISRSEAALMEHGSAGSSAAAQEFIAIARVGERLRQG